MIYFKPMLTSSTVSPSVLPGIAKTLEIFMLVYELDDMIAGVRKQTSSKLYSRGSKLYLKEAGPTRDADSGNKGKKDDLESKREEELNLKIQNLKGQIAEREKRMKKLEEEDEERNKQKINDEREKKEKEERELDKYKRDLDKYQREKEKQERDLKSSSVSIRHTEFFGKSLTIEPTWIQVDIEKSGVKTPSFIGVKVVPFPVKSDENLASLMLYDRQIGKIQTILIATGRKIIRKMWKNWYDIKSRIPFVGKGERNVSGDPRKDIIMARTSISDTFVCINYLDLNDDFFRSAGGVRKLFKLGWNSFIITDDVNKRAIYCMKEFKGVCSVVPYSYIYSSLGHAKAFESLEDVRKASSSIFSRRTNMSNMLSERLSKVLLDKFSKRG